MHKRVFAESRRPTVRPSITLVHCIHMTEEWLCIRIQIKLVSSYLTVVNIYLPPDKAIDKGELNKIFGHHTIVTGDINAKSKLWGSPVSNERGVIFEELIETHNAAVINTGQPTYQHHNGSRSQLHTLTSL